MKKALLRLISRKKKKTEKEPKENASSSTQQQSGPPPRPGTPLTPIAPGASNVNYTPTNVSVVSPTPFRPPTKPLPTKRIINLLELPPEIIHRIISFLPVDETLNALKQTCGYFRSTLELLILWNRSHLVMREAIDWELVNRVLATSYSIHSIDFTHCTGVTDHLIAAVVLVHPEISHVNITGCFLVSDFGLVKIEQDIKALKSLNISQCNMITCGGVYRVVRKHEQTIRELVMSECYGLAFDPFRMSRVADFCHNLETLSVGWPIHAVGMNPVMDMDLAKFSQTCPKLRVLDVTNGRLADTGVDAISEHLTKLEKLNLCHSCVRNSGIIKLTKSLVYLHHLDLTDCTYITDRGVMAVGESAKILTYLNLTRCFNITDKAVLYILNSLTSLKELYLGGCFRLTDKHIQWATKKLDQLFYLDMSNTLISYFAVDNIKRHSRDGFKLVIRKCPFVFYENLFREVEEQNQEWPPSVVVNPRASVAII